MRRSLVCTVALFLLAAAGQAQTSAHTLSWESALNPFLSRPTAGPLQLEDPALASPAAHSNTRLILSDRTWSEDLVDEVFNSGLSFGIEHDWRLADSGPGWEVGAFAFYDTRSESAGGASVSADFLIIELLLGGRYTQRLGASDFYVYAAGGADGALSYVDAQTQGFGLSASGSSTDFTVGGYAHAGGYYQLPMSLVVGIDLRQTFGLQIEDVDADYFQVGLTLGLGH